MDAFDRKILGLLQRDGRLTNQQLSDEVHLSPSQCSRRRVALEQTGVIRGYAARLDEKALGFGITVFISVQLGSHSQRQSKGFAELLARLDCVQEAHAMTGEMDYLLKVVIKDLSALQALVNGELLAHDAIAHVKSTICLETLKDDPALPLD